MRKRYRAIALIMTLMVTSVLLIMVSAFFSLNRDQIQLRRAGDATLRAQAAALSGLEYARMRLEVDGTWGLPGSGCARNISSPGLKVFENDRFSAGGIDTFCCVGVLDEGQSHFQINFVDPVAGYGGLPSLANGRVIGRNVESNPTGGLAAWGRETLPGLETSVNYLNSVSSFYPPVLSLSSGTGPLRTVPPKSCMLQIRGYYHGVVRTCDISLANEKPTDAGFQAGGQLALDINYDRGGRWYIRSLDPSKNKIQADGDIIVRGSDETDPGMRFQSGNASATSSGRIMTGTSAISSIDDPHDGTLTINGQTGVDVDVDVAGAKTGGKMRPSAGVSSVADLNAATVESQLNNPNFTQLNLSGGHYEFQDPSTLKLPDGSQISQIRRNGKIVARVEDYKLVFSEGVSVNFQGPTTIDSQGGKPSILMGYNTNALAESYMPWNSSGTFLKVTNGSLNIDGSVGGKGSLMATGNTTNQGDVIMRGRSQLSVDPDASVTVFADRNIKVSPPDPTSARFFSNDLAPISLAMRNYSEAQDLNNWSRGSRPLNDFASLGADQDYLTQGGKNPISDQQVGTQSIKTSPVDSNLSEIKSALIANFPVIDQNENAAAEFNAMYDKFMTGVAEPGMTVGRYLRLREFLRDLQSAQDSGSPLPSAATSAWGDLTARNESLNDQLKSEISFFNRKATASNRSFHNLIYDNRSTNPTENDLTNSMNARDAKWTGFLYARGSVAIDSGGGDLDIRGSLVARNDMAITNVTNVVSIYDPAYLKSASQFMVGNKLANKLWCDFYRIR
ncbi:hypothetical protein JST97_14860 [bacterium]|nr:hypothetical protein [bacterium]